LTRWASRAARSQALPYASEPKSRALRRASRARRYRVTALSRSATNKLRHEVEVFFDHGDCVLAVIDGPVRCRLGALAVIARDEALQEPEAVGIKVSIVQALCRGGQLLLEEAPV